MELQPAVQGAIIGAVSAISGVLASGYIQHKLKLHEENRRREEVAELVLLYCRRLRFFFRKFLVRDNLKKRFLLGGWFNKNDTEDIDFIIKETATKLPHVNLLLFDLRRILNNMQSYKEVIDTTPSNNELEGIFLIIESELNAANVFAHSIIQNCFSILSVKQKRKVIKNVLKDRTYRKGI